MDILLNKSRDIILLPSWVRSTRGVRACTKIILKMSCMLNTRLFSMVVRLNDVGNLMEELYDMAHQNTTHTVRHDTIIADLYGLE